MSELEKAFIRLKTTEMMQIINGLIEMMHDQKADIIDTSYRGFRADRLVYNDKEDEVFLHFVER